MSPAIGALLGMFAIAAVIVTGVAGALLQERSERLAAEAPRTSPATAHGPAARAALPLPVPALEDDGEPLSDAEAAVLDAVQWDSDWIGIQDARYGGDR